MRKFRIGDRVMMTANYGLAKAGMTGTVMCIVPQFSFSLVRLGIVFDKDMGGHGGNTRWYRMCEHGRGWNVPRTYTRYIGRRVNPDTVDVGKVEEAEERQLTAGGPVPTFASVIQMHRTQAAEMFARYMDERIVPPTATPIRAPVPWTWWEPEEVSEDG